MWLFRRLTERVTAREPRGLSGAANLLVVCVVGAIVALWVLWPAWMARPMRPTLDGEYVLQQIEIGKASLRYFHELPLYNPYDCHGIPMWDHPEGVTASPLLLLMTPLDGMTTYFLWDLIHVAAGFVGMWVLLRREMTVTRLAAFAGAALWACAPSLAAQTIARHSTMLDLYLAPLALYLWRRAAKSTPHAVGLGGLLVFMLLEGATYPLPMFALLLAMDGLTRMTTASGAKGVARAAAIVGLVTLTVGAMRWLPLADQMTQWKRSLVDEEATSLQLATMALFQKFQVTPPELGKVAWEWHEYQAYLGSALPWIALSGALLLPRGRRGHVVVAIFFGLLMIGHFHAYAPATLLKKVPLFSSMRVAPRYRHLFTLYACTFIALALDQLPEIVRTYRPLLATRVRAALALVVLASVGSVAGFASDLIALRFKGPPAVPARPSPRLYFGGPGLSSKFQDLPRQNRAWLGCRSYEWKNSVWSPVWEGDVPQVKVKSGDAEVLTSRRTANRFRARVRVRSNARLLLNTGYERSWQSNVGTVVADGEHRGSGGGSMLALDLGPGEHDVVVRYWPRRLTVSLFISALGIGGVIAWIVWRRRRARDAEKGGRAGDSSAPADASLSPE